MPFATLARCYLFAVHQGAFVTCVPVQYSVVWIYVLPRGYASILDQDTLVIYGLYYLDVSVGQMLYYLRTVLHMLCVVVLRSV